MGARPPFAVSPSQNTPLDLLNEMQFRGWVKKNSIPFDVNAPVSDYDMRGYYRSLMNGNPQAAPTQINPNDGQPHFTDYFKTPLHQTFSAESQYAGPDAPTWINDSQLASPGGKILFDEQRPPQSLFGLAP